MSFSAFRKRLGSIRVSLGVASRQGVPVRPAAVAARQAADENAHKNSAPRPPHPEEFRRLLCGLYHVVVTAAGAAKMPKIVYF